MASRIEGPLLPDQSSAFPSLAPPAICSRRRRGGPPHGREVRLRHGHGAQLHGQQHITRLAGQRAEYLRTQRLGFKAQTRFDMDGNITSAAQAPGPAEIDALATYLGGLP
jgi:hypothetical protein